MNCPSCGARLRLLDGCESAICAYCQAVYLPEKNEDGVRVFDEPADLLCPICHDPLYHATIARHRVCYCTKCRGVLIGMMAFVSLVQVLRAKRGEPLVTPRPEAEALDRRTRCPRCGNQMNTHFYAGGGNVIMDSCSDCEWNWLDAGELASIARAPGQWNAF